jgi:hypothetical protein
MTGSWNTDNIGLERSKITTGVFSNRMGILLTKNMHVFLIVEREHISKLLHLVLNNFPFDSLSFLPKFTESEGDLEPDKRR